VGEVAAGHRWLDATLPGVHIRPARAGDVPALIPLFEQWGHEQPEAVIAAQLDMWRRTPFAEVLVAEIDDAAAGVAAVFAAPHLAGPGRFGRLVGLVVANAHRYLALGYDEQSDHHARYLRRL
jgi:hypothetical protein